MQIYYDPDTGLYLAGSLDIDELTGYPGAATHYLRGDGWAAISTDGTLVDNSDTDIPSEKAVKTYADAIFPAGSTVTPSAETGWAGTPTYNLSYLTITKWVALYWFYITGTSDATNANITLPITAARTVYTHCSLALDNGTYTPNADCGIAASSSVLYFYLSGSATGWTNSGTKGVRGQIAIPI